MITILIGLACLVGIALGFIIATFLFGLIYIFIGNGFSNITRSYNIENIFSCGGKVWGILVITACILGVSYVIGLLII